MDVNSCFLSGVIERTPIVKYTGDHGSKACTFTLNCTEAGPGAQEFHLFVPCEAWASAADAAGDLNAGEAVLVAGKLKWTSYTDKNGQKRTNLCVLARLVKRLAPLSVHAAVSG